MIAYLRIGWQHRPSSEHGGLKTIQQAITSVVPILVWSTIEIHQYPAKVELIL